MPDSFVEEQIGEELPDESEVDDIGGHHPKPIGEESLASGPPDELRDFLYEEYGDANDAECFDGAREIFAEVEAVAVAAGKGAHEVESKGLPRRSQRYRDTTAEGGGGCSGGDVLDRT